MSDDLVKRLRAVGGLRHDGATRWYVNPDGPEAADRIEALEAALRGIAYILPKTDSNGIWWHQKVARLALGEKEDEQPMG